ncbi:MAG: P27 family phage terminase small subunit [Planctomycetaceae bacterium]|jgi:phage terminase small subunit
MTRKKIDIPAAPADLGEDGRRFWTETVETYQLTDAQLQILRFAARQCDRAAAARQRLATEGLTVVDHRGVPKENPIAAAERTAVALFLKLTKSLGLDLLD